MPIVAPDFLTLADLATRVDPDGKIASVVNLMSQTNEVIIDLPWAEANNGTSHKTTLLTSLPSVSWRALYEGVERSKSSTAQVTADTAMLRAFALVDRDLVKRAKDPAAFRMTEDSRFIESMNQTMAKSIFYGNIRTNPKEFTGLSTLYGSLTAGNAENIIDAGGTGSDLTSVWVACWGPNTGFGIYPQGSTAGLEVKDVTTDAPVNDEQGRPFLAYQTHYGWDCGLVVRDWRYFVRIANVSISALRAGTVDLMALLIEAVNRLPTQPSGAGPVQAATAASGEVLTSGKVVIYANRAVRTAMQIATLNKNNVLLNYETASSGGAPILRFMDIPVRTVDVLSKAETRVV